MAIGPYQLFFAVAVLLGMFLTERASSQPVQARLTYLAGVVGGVLGGRLWFSLQYGFSAGLQGFSLYGFGLGALVSALAYHRWQHGRWAPTDFPDTAAPAMALGTTIHRLGCFFTGCCFGKVCQLPWGVQYGPEHPAYWKQLDAGLIPASAEASLPIHPTQLYGVLAGLLAFITFNRLARSRIRLLRYEIFYGLAVGYSLYRFLMEFLRDDAGGRHLGPLTFSQATSVGVFVLCGYLLIRRRLRFRRGDQSLLRNPP